jgi:hypothetical protein
MTEKQFIRKVWIWSLIVVALVVGGFALILFGTNKLVVQCEELGFEYIEFPISEDVICSKNLDLDKFTGEDKYCYMHLSEQQTAEEWCQE